jgi:hypothetical protein
MVYGECDLGLKMCVCNILSVVVGICVIVENVMGTGEV